MEVNFFKQVEQTPSGRRSLLLPALRPEADSHPHLIRSLRPVQCRSTLQAMIHGPVPTLSRQAQIRLVLRSKGPVEERTTSLTSKIVPGLPSIYRSITPVSPPRPHL